MRALRIHLHQNTANYRKEETIDNKTTYPLPPYSTVIGALHDVCGFKEYKPMDISIQGNYESMQKRAYTDHCFLNSTQDDRGILVKLYNPECLSKGYIRVGSAIKSQGNSFKNNVTVKTENAEAMQEYRDLKSLKDKIDQYKKTEYAQKLDDYKKRKTAYSERKKQLDSKSDEYKMVAAEEKKVKEEEKEYKEKVKQYEYENYSIPISYFRTLTTSLKFYEILSNVELYIHVKSDEDTLQKIYEHIYELQSLGRSEDFAEVIDTQIVELADRTEKEITSKYAGYVSRESVDNKDILPCERNDKFQGCTQYYLNKKYNIVDNKRIFEKKKVCYLSEYEADQDSMNLYFDKIDDDMTLIVDFV